MLVHFNGRYIDESDVRISPFDRGFQFADGVYEVVRAYEGRFFRMSSHMARLKRSLGELRIPTDGVDHLPDVALELVARNGLSGRHSKFYVQITRGVAPRTHRFPVPSPSSTVFAAVHEITPSPTPEPTRIILTADTRWARRDIKSLMLLSNVLASQKAADAGADEAVFVSGNHITEGSHTGFAAVRDGELWTHPSGPDILPSITRDVVLEICDELRISIRREPVPVAELQFYDELLILGTTSEVSAVIEIDGRPIDGPGPITRRLQEAFAAKVDRELPS